MKLFEFQGKELFRKAKIPVPKGFVVGKASELKGKKLKGEYAVKTQLLSGGRGKAGGIRFATAGELPLATSAMLGNYLKGERIHFLLIEEKLDIAKELYLSIAVNRGEKTPVLVFTSHGGVDVEELSREHPEKVHKLPLPNGFEWTRAFAFFQKFEHSHSKELADLSAKLYALMAAKDLELVEVNPLALTRDGKLVAADAKVVVDDNALFRHPEFSAFAETNAGQKTALEGKAARKGLAYVELDGNVAIIGNGAGLVMATLDTLNYYKGRAANFLDVGGGADKKRMRDALEIVLGKEPSPRAVLINVFGGITRCEEIAQGLVEYKKAKGLRQPLVVRMIGTNEKQGRKILKGNSIHAVNSMEDAAKKAARLAGK